MRFATPGVTLTSKVIDGTFPDYQRVIPQANNKVMMVGNAEFANAVAFLNHGLIDGKPVITRILPYESAVEAFKLASDKSQSLKVLIAFDPEAIAA